MPRMVSWRFIPFFLLVVFTPVIVHAQTPVEFVLYVDADTLTVYVPGNHVVSLQGLGFEVTVNGQTRDYPLANYPAFGIPFDRLPTPLCFRLERDGTSRALPLDCQGKMTLIQRLPDADVFWYDSAGNQERVFLVVQGITPLGFCGAGQAQCNLTYTPSETQPPPQPSPPAETESEVPTVDPVNAALTQIAQSWTPTPPLDMTATAQQAMVYAMATLTGMAPTTEPPIASTRDPFVPVEHNADWTPVIQTFDGVEMVLVPAGCFMMGENGEGGQQCFDKPFWIDRYEVTNGQFNRLGGVAVNPSNWIDQLRPRESITWFEARDFCTQRRHGRLPTEAEWEYAARGPDGLIYPWGNSFEEDKVAYDGNSNNQAAAVGSHPSGVSWVGTLDMSGNVWEWVSSFHYPYPYNAEDGRESNDNGLRIVRGGSWSSVGDTLHAGHRSGYEPSNQFNVLGFRCARSY